MTGSCRSLPIHAAMGRNGNTLPPSRELDAASRWHYDRRAAICLHRADQPFKNEHRQTHWRSPGSPDLEVAGTTSTRMGKTDCWKRSQIPRSRRVADVPREMPKTDRKPCTCTGWGHHRGGVSLEAWAENQKLVWHGSCLAYASGANGRHEFHRTSFPERIAAGNRKNDCRTLTSSEYDGSST
jgi:hypothetical protein